MNLITPTLEEREKLKKERMEIIDSIMKIQELKPLHHLAVITRQIQYDSATKIPLRLDEFVEMLEVPMIIRLYDLFKNEEDGLVVNDQMKELLARMIDRINEIESEENT